MRTRDFNSKDDLLSIKVQKPWRRKVSNKSLHMATLSCYRDLDQAEALNNTSESTLDDEQLIKCYQLRIRRLEADRKKLYRHIDDCYDYIDLQKSNNSKLLNRIQQLEGEPGEAFSSGQPEEGSDYFIHVIFVSGLLAYTVYLVLSLTIF